MLNLSILNWYSHPSYNVLQPIRHVSILFQGKVLRNFVCFVFHVSLYVALTVKSINSPPYPLFLYIIFASESNLNIFSSVIQVNNGLLRYCFSVCNLPSCMPCLSTCLFHKKLWNDTLLIAFPFGFLRRKPCSLSFVWLSKPQSCTLWFKRWVTSGEN